VRYPLTSSEHWLLHSDGGVGSLELGTQAYRRTRDSLLRIPSARRRSRRRTAGGGRRNGRAVSGGANSVMPPNRTPGRISRRTRATGVQAARRRPGEVAALRPTHPHPRARRSRRRTTARRATERAAGWGCARRQPCGCVRAAPVRGGQFRMGVASATHARRRPRVRKVA
jgi:hypothetical protein